jgi:hypothetical protein
MVHVANEIVPIWIVINKTCAVNVELEESLKPFINSFKIISIAFDLHNIKHLWACCHNLRFIISLLHLFNQNAMLCGITLLKWHILFKL